MTKAIGLGVVLMALLYILACSAVRPQPSSPPSPSATTPGTQPAPPSQSQPAPEVPAEWQALYQELSAELRVFENLVRKDRDGSHSEATIAVEMAYANGNVGEWLLSEQVWQYNLLLLDRLEAMGVKGVVIDIKFPLLQPDFPRSAEYLNFFKNITAECQRRGFKVLVEGGAIFSGTPYSPVKVNWSRYTADSFLKSLQDELLLIAREVKPDYLNLTNEPLTQQWLSGFNIPPAKWNWFVADTLRKIDRSSGMLIGAGIGTWEPAEYIEGFFQMPGLDHIDLHIYPMNKGALYIQRALEYARRTKMAGKRLTVGESWLWKAFPEEVGAGGLVDEKIMNRDAYSFWEPLDIWFIRNMVSLADATGMDFVSFFWTRKFFAYLEYGPATKNLSTAELNRALNQAGLRNVLAGELSSLGKDFAALLYQRGVR